MANIHSFTFNALQENTYILWDDTLQCCIIDPGCYTIEEQEELKAYIYKNKLSPKLLLNTHCHVDHVLGNAFVKKQYNIPLYIHKLDESTLRSVKVYASSYGFNKYQESVPDIFIKEEDIISFGKATLKVLFVPGHAPGHVAFYDSASNYCISGDVLFNNSIGRTDLPGGSFDILIKSIKNQLLVLPENTVIYPGHGPNTTIGKEKKYNPFLKAIS